MITASLGLRPLRETWHRFGKDRRGAILFELAMALPIITAIVIGGFDTGRFVLLHQKMDRAAGTMADLVSRPPIIASTDIDLMFSAATELLEPFELNTMGTVIMSSVSREPDAAAVVDWQYTGAGPLSATSQIGVVGAAPTLPSGMVVREGENLIVAEVFFDYEPVFLGFLFEPKVLSHMAIRRPRRGDLSTLY